MKWISKQSPENKKIEQLSFELGIDKTLSKLLVMRGIDDFEKAKKFFRPTLNDLHDPFLMKDMQKAVDRILLAIQKEEAILIYGDYDVDGTTAVSLVYSYLREFYPKVATYIPDRYEEGYGISFQGIDFASDNEITLIIALDCGIKAIDKVLYAKEKGIDFIICDHHRPGETIPAAAAVLDPKRTDCPYPYDELCGCGVGFKLIQALQFARGLAQKALYEYLDLVAIAIAADIVPVTGENRILATYGLKMINENPRPGIEAMLKSSTKSHYTITDLVFTLAPRINAAGRMKHGRYAVEILTERNIDKAQKYAEVIEINNQDRRAVEQEIEKEALAQIIELQEENQFSTVVYAEHWHKGVIGIVASRLIENYYRPTLVFTSSNGKLAASARSVSGFDVYNALEECAEFIEQFGGHKYAAGLTLLPENYDHFKRKFEEVVKNSIPETSLEPQILVDSEIDLTEITPKFYRVLKQFGPFGPMNMKPVFLTTGLRDNGYGRKVGADEKHLKVNVIGGGEGQTYGAIGFGLGHKYPVICSGKPFDAVFTIEENHFNGQVSLQLNLKDICAEDLS
ncbi:single-stranded-DNA-specific exonuclease RecJ [Namhaeicola litoreus]|uniref:Single-stranded-DNA-specific exonuclease RecJ n=1 Tax=Namhaeicola litoreus TaxID=1052145 RepID=A0ABW3Y304_9FLAO